MPTFSRTAAFKTFGPTTIEITIPGTTEHPGNVMRIKHNLRVDVSGTCFVRAHSTSLTTMWTPTTVTITVADKGSALIIVGIARGSSTFGEVVNHPHDNPEYFAGTVVVPPGNGVFKCDL
jgi:hypothetical protein